MRLIKEKSPEYGYHDWSVQAKTTELLAALTQKLDEMGWKEKNTQCDEHNDYGFATSYTMSSKDEQSFREDFQVAKKMCLSKIVKA